MAECNLPCMELVNLGDVCKQDGTIFPQSRWYKMLHAGLVNHRHVSLSHTIHFTTDTLQPTMIQ